MPTIPPRFNWGSEIRNINEVLYNQLSESYSSSARVINTKVTKNVTTTNPPADDALNISFEIGDLWINQSTNVAWIMTSRTTNTAATWSQIT